MNGLEAATKMRALSDEDRDAAITGAPNVHDARSAFAARAKQVQLAEAYRRGSNDPDGKPTPGRTA